ncbi:hypothetical protein BFP70_00600 [Thioclava sp. SK-1]|uniref:di-heme oxidoreductase family protein n=1 Tax=Thioclava sp. SK-1 TaxID=1889770 RepID=UPI0008265563|nr:di-heme oxidoredictase family protein [Thioclava sp. SK-1]OCX66824.1 hypothetical protein BFP70_00600 [Thioclava sp. SK-1]
MMRFGVLLAVTAVALPVTAQVLPPPAHNPADQPRVQDVIRPAQTFTAAERFEARPAGAGTSRGTAFSQPLTGLDDTLDFRLGEALFDKLWVPSPSSTRGSDGLGPLFNARACANCHPADARGAPPAVPGQLSGMVLKLSGAGRGVGHPLADQPGFHPVAPDPQLGLQLQDRALPSLMPEGALQLSWVEHDVGINGATVLLRRPLVQRPDRLAPDSVTSLRVAPQLIGLGLLQAVPAAQITVRADPDDTDDDGVSGRAQLAWSPSAGRAMLGRFGHKADAASLRDMAAAAFVTDMGLSSPAAPFPQGDCTLAQPACLALPNGEDAGLRDGHEVSASTLDLVALYARSLAVPARRDVADPQVLRGKAAFYGAGCTACHTPKYVTARGDVAATSFQLIWPYTDMLLHDMGPGLADGRTEGLASGAEWRTAPLWGIGLTQANTGQPATYLHDGRARTLLEAILWHGGEATQARDKVAEMSPAMRDDLIRFLESL